MTETYCDSDDVKLKAGKNAATLTAAQYTILINDAEATINAELREDPIAAGTYSGLTSSKKLIFRTAASCLAAISVIAYDQDSFTSGEATNLLNSNWTQYENAIRLLKMEETTDFIGV